MGPPEPTPEEAYQEPVKQNSKWQSAEKVCPFLRFGDMPDQENLFDSLPHRHGSGNRIKPGHSLPPINSPKCRGIVRTSCVYQNTAQRCSNSENLRIGHAFGDDALRQFEINFRLTAKNACDDILIKIGIGEKSDSQCYLGRASSRVRSSFFDKLSGSVG